MLDGLEGTLWRLELSGSFYQPWRELGTHSTKAFALGLLRRKKV